MKEWEVLITEVHDALSYIVKTIAYYYNNTNN